MNKPLLRGNENNLIMDKKTYYSGMMKESYEIALVMQEIVKQVYPQTQLDVDMTALSIFDKIARPWVYARAELNKAE